MGNQLMNQGRIEQTRRQLAILKEDVKTGLQRRRDKDKLKQYHTQLSMLEQVLTDSLATIGAKIKDDANMADTAAPGEVYAACRKYDESTLLLRRVLTYYQTKYDQREDSRLKTVVAAADEVVWSCYAGVFEKAKGEAKPSRPIPLPYIEPAFSPKAVPRDEPPHDLSTTPRDELLWQYLQQLPIPVVSLPPMCVEQPWWLIYLGHELGHHLQYDLVPGKGLVNSFQELLRKTVQGAAAADQYAGDPNRWKAWGEEIFADICSVYCMGPWAVRAIVELVLTDAKTMLNYANVRYPPPLVRLEVLAQVAKYLGLDRTAALGPADLDAILAAARLAPADPQLARVKRDRTLANTIVKVALKEQLGGIGTFDDLYDWRPKEFTPGGSVVIWTEALRHRVDMPTEKVRRSARRIVSAAVAAWVEVTALADPADAKAREQARQQLEQARQQLAQDLGEALQANREEGDRPAAPDAIDVTGLGARLAERTLDELQKDG